MFCEKCGNKVENEAKFCKNCGAKLSERYDQANDEELTVLQPSNTQPPVYSQQPMYSQPPVQTQYTYVQNNSWKAHAGSVSFVEAIKLFFVNYANFTGRASRSEYWWAFLFNFLVSMVCGYIPIVGPIITLGLLIPGLAIAIRRLHDTGKSWVWILMGLIPLAGFIILIVFYCKESDGDNKWGPGPKKY